MKFPLDRSTVPTGGEFRYQDPDSGIKLSHPYYIELKKLALTHRDSNNYPVGVNWETLFDDNVCENTPGLKCLETPSLGKQASDFAVALVGWARQGFTTVSEELFQKRIQTCLSCEHWQSKKGFRGKCAVCGCKSLKQQLTDSVCPIGKW